MRDSNHANRRRADTGATGPNARATSPTYTPEHQETLRQGLRILARIIARAHLRRQAQLDTPIPDP